MTNAIALNTFLPAENCGAEAPPVYRLAKSFAVVRFDSAGKGRIAFLPEGADVRLVGPSPLRQCLEVLWGDQICNIFQVDLLGPWSTPVRNNRRGAARVKATAACA